MNVLSFGRLKAFILLFFCLFLSACGAVTLSPSDAMVRGSESLDAEGYVQRYSGNSIAFSWDEPGGVPNRETYFGTDGSYYAVDLEAEFIGYGTWTVHSVLGSSKINLNVVGAGISDGEAYREAPVFITIYTFVLPDGTASTFSRSPEGPARFVEPQPTPGFQARARFDAIKRKIDAALGS
jgi:hypothetical protein